MVAAAVNCNCNRTGWQFLISIPPARRVRFQNCLMIGRNAILNPNPDSGTDLPGFTTCVHLCGYGKSRAHSSQDDGSLEDNLASQLPGKGNSKYAAH